MRYTVKEKLDGGQAVYAVIEREDGSTYGQLVPLAGIKTQADLDARVLDLHLAAEDRTAPAESRAARDDVVDAVMQQTRTVSVDPERA